MDRQPIQILTPVPFELDGEAIRQRVHVETGSDDAGTLSALVRSAREVGRPKALFKEAYIDAKADDTVTIEGVTFTSRVLRTNLAKAERVFVYIATCGREFDGVEIDPGDLLAEFWLDTIKASALGSCLAYLSDLLDRKFALGKTSVMHPGSGDATVWPIQQQQGLFSLLGEVCGSIGVELTDTFLMVPNKTVSGIRFATEVDFRSCQLCHREPCPSRSAPFDQALWESMEHA